MKYILVFAIFKKGAIQDIVEIMEKFRQIDEMVAISDEGWGYAPGRLFQFHMVCSPEHIESVKEAFRNAEEVGIVEDEKEVNYHYKWNRELSVDPACTL
jgi:hypothetical protein